MKILFKFIVVIFVLFLGGNVYGQSIENVDNAKKDAAINQTKKSTLEAEQNMLLQIELLNRIMLNKYSKTNSSYTFNSYISFTEDANGFNASESRRLGNTMHYFDGIRNAHIPISRSYESFNTDKYNTAINPEILENWCDELSPIIEIE